MEKRNLWDGPLTLKEMYGNQEQEILRYVADYKVNLVQPAAMSDEGISLGIEQERKSTAIKLKKRGMKLGEIDDILDTDEKTIETWIK